jgi:hypothetical protein
MDYFKAPEGIVLEKLRKTTKHFWLVCVPTEMKETLAEYNSEMLPPATIRTATGR